MLSVRRYKLLDTETSGIELSFIGKRSHICSSDLHSLWSLLQVYTRVFGYICPTRNGKKKPDFARLEPGPLGRNLAAAILDSPRNRSIKFADVCHSPYYEGGVKGSAMLVSAWVPDAVTVTSPLPLTTDLLDARGRTDLVIVYDAMCRKFHSDLLQWLDGQ